MIASVAGLEIIRPGDQYEAGGRYPIVLRVSISSPWYIHGPSSEGDILIPTRIFFQKYQGFRLEDVRFPEPKKKKFEYAKKPVQVYSGVLDIRALLVIDQDAPPGRHVIKGEFSYQACSSTSCLAPETIPILLPLSIASSKRVSDSVSDAEPESKGKGLFSSESSSGRGLWLTLLGFFLAGLAQPYTLYLPFDPHHGFLFRGKEPEDPGADPCPRPFIYLWARLYQLGPRPDGQPVRQHAGVGPAEPGPALGGGGGFGAAGSELFRPVGDSGTLRP